MKMKQFFSVITTVCILLCCLTAPSSAASGGGVIALRLHSDVAGYSSADTEKILEILSPQVKYIDVGNAEPVSVANYAGFPETGQLTAGRQYAVTCLLVAADGYSLPESLKDGDVSYECGKGVKVLRTDVVKMRFSADSVQEDVQVLRIVATVVADGSLFQRIIGWVSDIILKIRTWQLY